HTYYLDKASLQLMHYDGGAGADVPAVDHVVGLSFEYFAEPQPPMLKKPASDPAGPWTTYGPKPKPLGTPSGTAWPDGENCVFMVDPAGGPLQVPRLGVMGGGALTLAKLTAAELADGPWCPD